MFVQQHTEEPLLCGVPMFYLFKWVLSGFSGRAQMDVCVLQFRLNFRGEGIH